MTIDGITLAAALSELRSLYNAKIEKVYQPTSDEILLHLHTEAGKKRLLISASGSDCRIHLTESSRINPLKAPNFCMVLRKYLTGGRIAGILQFGLDRIVHVLIEARDELSIIRLYTLAVELMGKYSNIILIGPEGKILDSLRHVSIDTSSKRQVLPGIKYVLPPSNKLDPLTEEPEKLAAALYGVDLPRGILRLVQGVSPATADELVNCYFKKSTPGYLAEEDALRFVTILRNFIRQAIQEPNACLQMDMSGIPVFFSALPYQQYPVEGRKYFPSVNLMIDSFYATREAIKTLETARANLLRIIRKSLARVEKKLKIQMETLQAGEDAQKYFLYGELVSSNIYQLKRGMTSAELYNYYQNENISVPLEAAFSPAQNAARYYKRAAKMKNGAVIAKERGKEYADERDFLQSLEYEAISAPDMENLLEVEAELIRYGYVQTEERKKIIRKDPLEAPRRFLTSGGLTALAGRNSRQNDALTTKVAAETDIWFHAKNMPGSHVILFTKGQTPGEQDIFEAASIAAVLSGGKDAGKVCVDYTQKANVWKQNGARPGMVYYKNQRSLFVSPDKELIAKLEETTMRQIDG